MKPSLFRIYCHYYKNAIFKTEGFRNNKEYSFSTKNQLKQLNQLKQQWKLYLNNQIINNIFHIPQLA